MSPKYLGGASAQALQASLPSAPSSGLGDAFSFERAAGQAIDQVRRASRGIQLPTSDSINITYVFCDDLDAVANTQIFDSVNIVWSSDLGIKLVDLENRVILLSRSGGAGCRSKATFQTLSEHANFVQQHGLLSSAAVAFQLAHCQATMYPQGMVSPEHNNLPFGTSSSLLIGTALDEALKHFDESWVNSPKGHATFWAKNDKLKYVPCPNTEKAIQRDMHLSLTSADRGGVVLDEIPNSNGRADLWLYSDTPQGRQSVVIELKVLRSYCYPEKRASGLSEVNITTNENDAKEVVNQAYSYKNSLKAQRGLACLYDMRKPPIQPSPMDAAKALSKRLQVDLRYCKINFSSKTKRQDAVAEKIKT